MKSMRTLLLGTATFLFATSVLALSSDGDELRVSSVAKAQRRHMDYCVRQQRPSWNDTCEDGYHVQLKNVCDETIRVHWCVRQNDGDLHCGVQPSLRPGAVSDARACNAARPGEVIYEACSAGEPCRVNRAEHQR